MKFIKKFESFNNTYAPSGFSFLNTNIKNEIYNEVEKYISKLSNNDLSKIEYELYNFAKSNNCGIDNLSDSKFVEEIITDKTNDMNKFENKHWVYDNWETLCKTIGISGNVLSAVLFITAIVLNSSYNMQTLTMMKIAVVAHIISSLVLAIRPIGKILRNED
jgi:hypothetical protein